MARNLGVPYTDKEPYYFISYNSEDEERVSEYALELDNCGVPMWYDNGIEVATEWETEIAERIDRCTAVIMFLSESIFLKDNSYVHKEFELATEYSQKKVYVMMLDEIKKPNVPIRFRAWWTNVTKLQCINTYEFNSSKACVQKLLENGVEGTTKSITEMPVENSVHNSVTTTGNVSESTKKGYYDKVVYDDGSTYGGYFVDGKRNGEGKLTYANGSVYEGDFVDDEMTGLGEFHNTNGDTYYGDFRNGKFNGEGVYYFANGDVYEGSFVDGKRTGKGWYSWTNGDEYEGDFVDGKRTGKGKYEWESGDEYEGDFVDGKRHGRGQYIFANGDMQKGVYIEGKIFNGFVYDINGRVKAKYINGKRKNVQ